MTVVRRNDLGQIEPRQVPEEDAAEVEGVFLLEHDTLADP
jgi:hypothetical protein